MKGSEAIEKFLELNFRLSDVTRWNYRIWLNKFFSFIKKDFEEIEREDIAKFINYLLNKGVKKESIDIYLKVLSKFFRVLGRDDLSKYCRENQFRKAYTYRIVYLTDEEAKRFFSVIKNPVHKLIFALMHSTGMRVKEVLGIRKSDVMFDKGETGMIRIVGKGDKERYVPIHPALRKALKKYCARKKDDELLFPYDRRTVYYWCAEYTSRAGIKKKVSPHVFRHTFAINFLRRGGNISELQQLLGHSSLKPTTVYLAVTSEDLSKRYIEVMVKSTKEYEVIK